MLKLIFELLRVRQWAKNLFVFAPLIFAGRLFEQEDIINSLIGFVLFSLVSSAAYIFNDVKDVESDRLHPVKRLRPIASGRISFNAAMQFFLLLSVLSLVLSYFLNAGFGIVIAAYLVLNICYSAILKKIVAIDVLIVASGFVLRILGGAQIIYVRPSWWLITCTALLSLLLAFGKRRQEAHNKITAGANYNIRFLSYLIWILSFLNISAYIMYTISPRTVDFFGTKKLIFTVPFVVFGIARYLYLLFKEDKGDDPTEIFLKDLPLLADVVLWIASAGVIIYYH
ncbi:MAG: decaprenyl-phosphate phosphoribosyltransferase [Planctomycetes bacterium]|nr:decaprenyl-phosphate phosphoribosyltransferase [Planctomycetota bacterium]